MLNADLHIHTKYSFDSLSSPKRIIKTAQSHQINCIAITDHNTIRGAIEAKKYCQDNEFSIIVGCEVSSEIGDIIGLFLSSEISSRTALEIIDEIKNQGGIAVLPHPFKGHKLEGTILTKFDAIEGFNGRTSVTDNSQAMELAKRLKKPVTAGSDAHFLGEIGSVQMKLGHQDGFTAREFFKLLPSDFENVTCRENILYYESLSQFIKSYKTGLYGAIPGQIFDISKQFMKHFFVRRS
jgi:predicted metal-dependent phosphoesterase TrpH